MKTSERTQPGESNLSVEGDDPMKSNLSVEGDDPMMALERVRDHALPAQVQPLIDGYEATVGDRDEFLWKWAHHLFPRFTLSCVAPKYVDATKEAKLVGLIFVSILDDVAEKHQEWATFEEAAKLPFEHRTANYDRAGVDGEVLAFANDVWDHFESILGDGPRAAEFDDIVRFDLKRVCTAMEYSYLANQHLDVITETELQTYDAHNMMMYGFADVDLVHSPAFDRSDLATLRRVIERAQRMVRIGNWITTWERELAECDFTSGIVAYALDQHVISVDELRAIGTDNPASSVAGLSDRIRDHDVESVFLRQWDEELAAARTFEGAFESVDIGAYLDGIETIMEYHLATRGIK